MSAHAYDRENIFAKILRGEAPCHKLREDEMTLSFLNIMPESKGHALVIPKYPARDIFSLPAAHLSALMAEAQRTAAALREAFAPEGMFLYQLNGVAAGQSVFHIHMHVVPRYEGVPLRSHEEGMEDNAVLAEQAEQVRAALERLASSA